MKHYPQLFSLILPFTIFLCFLIIINVQYAYSQEIPLRIGVIGLTHDHVNWILGQPDRGDIQIVGIVESNRDLTQRYAERYGFSIGMMYNTIEEMITATKPEAVTAFGRIYDHLKVVEICAPRGIHIMVEKPLAISMEHARKMKFLAEKHGIHLLTNYETTWYPTNHKAFELVHSNDIGELRKVVVHDGHQGPKEIGVSDEFLQWLTDPVLNGGGAVMDFGCYGANLITWLKNGKKPEAVMAVTQTFKPDIYPKVDDEATILLIYPDMQGIIQASWNWPYSRKDMQIYGRSGYIFSDNRLDIRFRLKNENEETKMKLEERQSPQNDPFSYLAAVVRNKITMSPYDLSSLENNMIVVEILEAAKESAKTGSMINLIK